MSSTAVQSQAKEDLKEKPLYIDVTQKGFMLNDNRINGEEELFLKLKGELSRKRDKTVLVTVEKKVKHGSMVKVLDLAKQAGANNLSLLKRKAR